MKIRTKTFSVLPILLVLIFGTFDLFAADPVRPGSPWKKRASAKWSGTPLRESLKRFGEHQKFNFLLDRRVDPSLSLEFEATNREVGQILHGLAESLDLGCFLFDSVAYVGPKEWALTLPRLVAEHRKSSDSMSPELKKIFRKNVDLEIPFLSDPREILKTLAERNALRWDNLDELPHDRWDENSLGKMPLDELLLLLLIGFNADFSGDRTLTLVPISEQYRKEAVAATTKIRPATRNSRRQAEENDIPLTRRRFTLQVEEQRLDNVLKTVSERLGLKFRVDEESLKAKGVSLERRISFDVKNVTANALFRAILKPLNLEFQIRDDTIHIR